MFGFRREPVKPRRPFPAYSALRALLHSPIPQPERTARFDLCIDQREAYRAGRRKPAERFEERRRVGGTVSRCGYDDAHLVAETRIDKGPIQTASAAERQGFSQGFTVEEQPQLAK